MAALTASQLVTVRRRVGDKPADATVQAIYDRTGTLTETVREILDTRLANLLLTPASFNAPGQWQQSTEANIRATQAAIDDLGNLDNDDPADDGDGIDTVRILSTERARVR